jgi:hypothetical protein
MIFDRFTSKEPSPVKTYRCKHSVEAMHWTDTDEDRERFAAWFERHGYVFETHGSKITLPEQGSAPVGTWILYTANDEFLMMADAQFTATYAEVA